MSKLSAKPYDTSSYIYPGAHLTPRELRVGEQLLRGLSAREIGEVLGSSGSTVKTIIQQMCIKMYIFSGEKHVRLALAVHEHRKSFGISCPCDLA